MIAGLLLAAGFGRRFGGNKLVAELHGVPIIRRSFGAIAGCDACYVVVPAEHAAIESALGTLAPIFIVNERAEDGMSASIRAGVAALPNNCEAVIIALGDQPFTSPAVAAQLVDAWRETGAPAVVPHYQGGAGHPVLFACETFPALLALNGDMGAKPVLRRWDHASLKFRSTQQFPTMLTPGTFLPNWKLVTGPIHELAVCWSTTGVRNGSLRHVWQRV